jgi:hypothetical protein
MLITEFRVVLPMSVEEYQVSRRRQTKQKSDFELIFKLCLSF